MLWEQAMPSKTGGQDANKRRPAVALSVLLLDLDPDVPTYAVL